MTSARRCYRVNLLFGVAGLTAVLLAAIVTVRAVDIAPPPAHHLQAACARVLPCGPAPAALLVLTLTIAVAFLGVRSLARQLMTHRRARRRLAVVRAIRHAGVGAVLIADRRPRAFCAGYLRPRAHVSTGAVALLSERELAAVLRHEAHHVRRRDPLRLLVVQVLADALFFLPALGRLRTRYAETAELAADEAAVRAVRDPAPLASALLTFDAGVRAGAGGIAPERVDRLLGERTRWDAPVASIAGGLATLLALVLAPLTVGGALGSARPELSLAGAQICIGAIALAPIALALARRGAPGGRVRARR